MQPDRDLIQGKIDIIEKNLNFLNEYKEMDEIFFLSNYKDIQAVKYSLFEIIEVSIDIASHLISVNGFERAETYAEMFEILGKKKIINLKLSNNLSAMARFRNILVHSYAKVDNSKVLAYIKEELKDVKDNINAVLKFLNLSKDF